MKLVVGLGNPGKKYEVTRHNAGFWWVERLAHGDRIELRHSLRYHGRVGKLGGPNEIWLQLPDTYMNDSGRAVAALAAAYAVLIFVVLLGFSWVNNRVARATEGIYE